MKKGKTPLFCNKKAIIPIFFVSILWFLYGGKRWIRIRARASVLARIAKRPAPKQVVQAQCAARCIPRRIHDSQHKKRHRDFSEEVDSLSVGQFLNIQQNAVLCSAIISNVHNGAVAVHNGANGCFATVLHPLSFAQKKKASEFRCFLFCE